MSRDTMSELDSTLSRYRNSQNNAIAPLQSMHVRIPRGLARLLYLSSVWCWTAVVLCLIGRVAATADVGGVWPDSDSIPRVLHVVEYLRQHHRSLVPSFVRFVGHNRHVATGALGPGEMRAVARALARKGVDPDDLYDQLYRKNILAMAVREGMLLHQRVVRHLVEEGRSSETGHEDEEGMSSSRMHLIRLAHERNGYTEKETTVSSSSDGSSSLLAAACRVWVHIADEMVCDLARLRDLLGAHASGHVRLRPPSLFPPDEQYEAVVTPEISINSKTATSVVMYADIVSSLVAPFIEELDQWVEKGVLKYAVRFMPSWEYAHQKPASWFGIEADEEAVAEFDASAWGFLTSPMLHIVLAATLVESWMTAVVVRTPSPPRLRGRCLLRVPLLIYQLWILLELFSILEPTSAYVPSLFQSHNAEATFRQFITMLCVHRSVCIFYKMVQRGGSAMLGAESPTPQLVWWAFAAFTHTHSRVLVVASILQASESVLMNMVEIFGWDRYKLLPSAICGAAQLSHFIHTVSPASPAVASAATGTRATFANRLEDGIHIDTAWSESYPAALALTRAPEAMLFGCVLGVCVLHILAWMVTGTHPSRTSRAFTTFWPRVLGMELSQALALVAVTVLDAAAPATGIAREVTAVQRPPPRGLARDVAAHPLPPPPPPPPTKWEAVSLVLRSALRALGKVMRRGGVQGKKHSARGDSGTRQAQGSKEGDQHAEALYAAFVRGENVGEDEDADDDFVPVSAETSHASTPAASRSASPSPGVSPIFSTAPMQQLAGHECDCVYREAWELHGCEDLVGGSEGVVTRRRRQLASQPLFCQQQQQQQQQRQNQRNQQQLQAHIAGHQLNARAAEDDETRNMCVVCTTSRRAVLLFPCRCLALCDGCRDELARRRVANCPTCRTKVDGYARIYEP